MTADACESGSEIARGALASWLPVCTLRTELMSDVRAVVRCVDARRLVCHES